MVSVLEEVMTLPWMYRAIFWLCVLLAPFAAHVTNAASSVETARQFVEQYCLDDFRGNGERFDTYKFSTDWLRQAKTDVARKERMTELISWFHHPVIVVSDYEILSVDVKSTQGKVLVRYTRLVRSEGLGVERNLVPDKNPNDLITLSLVFDQNQWWVLDPPPPRISKEVLIRHYEEEIKNLGVEDHPKWQKERDTVKLLKSLP